MIKSKRMREKVGYAENLKANNNLEELMYLGG
jgi:hypothetical protein